ncbi:MAG: hypothetical protein DCC57_12850 [Chloroflexi bacterium]|nr:MAG: hypothetical protein DCC57_12850 [Chloroflexota bacterium]
MFSVSHQRRPPHDSASPLPHSTALFGLDRRDRCRDAAGRLCARRPCRSARGRQRRSRPRRRRRHRADRLVHRPAHHQRHDRAGSHPRLSEQKP